MQPPPSPLRRARELRRDQTDAEHRLWLLLRNRRFMGRKFRRQVSVGGYIVDFLCHEAMLIIELDGTQHVTRHEYDEERTRFLQHRGFRVLRFWNNDVVHGLEGVLEAI